MVNQSDEKNIRRRVYDALNVLMALDIIARDKKEIWWKGLPNTNIKDLEEIKVGKQPHSLLLKMDTKFYGTTLSLSLSHTHTHKHTHAYTTY